MPAVASASKTPYERTPTGVWCSNSVGTLSPGFAARLAVKSVATEGMTAASSRYRAVSIRVTGASRRSHAALWRRLRGGGRPVAVYGLARKDRSNRVHTGWTEGVFARGITVGPFLAFAKSSRRRQTERITAENWVSKLLSFVVKSWPPR